MEQCKKTICWETYFDRVFCLYYLPNKARMPRLENELARIGLLDSSVFEWRFTTPCPYDKIIQDSYSDKTWINNIGCMNGALETNRILKESLLLGYKRILIIEDDVAFLNDIDKLEDILKNIPDGYDVVQLDKGCWGKAKVREWDLVRRNKINNYFVDSGRYHFGLSSANIFSPSGMKLAINVLDKKPIACDQINANGIFKWAVALENACIQILFNKSNYNSAVSCHCIYRDIGIDYKKYAVPVGYSFSTLYTPRDDLDFDIKKNKKAISNKGEKNRWDRFDYLAVVCYTGYKDRVEALMPELERIGMREKIHLHWDFPSELRNKLAAVIKKSAFCAKGACFFMTMQHYSVVKTAYELGCKNILVLEDDVRFLKSLLAIDEILDSIPLDYDHLMFDRNKLTTTELTEFASVANTRQGQKWVEFKEAGSTGCYAMSRRGMKHYIDLLEHDMRSEFVRNPDFYFRSKRDNKTYWDDTYRRYFCYPNMTVQSICGRNGSFSDLSDYWHNLKTAGIKQEDYNMDFQIVTDSNYLTLLYDTVQTNKGLSGGTYYNSEPLSAILSVAGLKNRVADARQKADSIYIWGNGASKINMQLLQQALRDKSRIILCEDGFIRSIYPHVCACPDKYKAQFSVLMDSNAYHFDSTRVSDIERMLNDLSLIVTPEQRVEARRLIDKITSNKISRYNHQPTTAPKFGREGKENVLVIDQTRGDMCVTLGMADDTTFKKMLETAIKENPDADILVKTHPCSFDGSPYGEGYFQDLKEHDNLYKITSPINPYSLMEVCDKVYVVTSQFGLEALMANKEVHVFGMPFYAGWGLTIDDQKLERRTNMRTIEELFYIFYCMYTHWIDPDKKCETTIDAVIDKIIALRRGLSLRTNTVINPVHPSPRCPNNASPVIIPRSATFKQRADPFASRNW